MEIDKIAKRFQFDLEMGIFEPYDTIFKSNVYYFYSYNFAEIDIFEEIVKTLGFMKDNSRSTDEDPYGIRLEITPLTKFYNTYGFQELMEDEDNPIPNYIKELVYDGEA